jgi:ankyrin repeat protein
VTALLAEGAPVDAVDAEGETALMKSVQADQPAVAALLRRRGASLAHQNLEGVSARDMAERLGNAEMNRALGIEP